jgi:hypothetical protein
VISLPFVARVVDPSADGLATKLRFLRPGGGNMNRRISNKELRTSKEGAAGPLPFVILRFLVLRFCGFA